MAGFFNVFVQSHTLRFYTKFWEHRAGASSYLVKLVFILELLTIGMFVVQEYEHVSTLLTANYWQQTMDAFPDTMQFTLSKHRLEVNLPTPISVDAPLWIRSSLYFFAKWLMSNDDIWYIQLVC